jgi:hypothetical protein
MGTLGELATKSMAAEKTVTDFEISRFGASSSWYYGVTLRPVLQPSRAPSETFTALMDLAGTPGRVFELGPHQGRR